jgi:probable O-glycosylation ligase (exosortase A-associated)
VPILLYLSKHAILVPRWRIVRLGYLGLAGLALVASIGTHQRSGLIGIVVLAAALWLRTKHKVLVGAACILGAVTLLYAASDSWTQRMGTIDDYNSEASARGRILVWQWTLGFVADHPLGGGFNSFVVNEIRTPGDATNPEGSVIHGKAFHSIYFETLGEHGWIGLGLFLAINIATLLSLQRVIRRSRGSETMAWCGDLAAALQVSLLVLLASGAFIGIAFQPMFWYLFAAAGCLAHHVGRAIVPAVATQRQQAVETAVWTRRNAIAARPRRGLTGS